MDTLGRPSVAELFKQQNEADFGSCYLDAAATLKFMLANMQHPGIHTGVALPFVLESISPIEGDGNTYRLNFKHSDAIIKSVAGNDVLFWQGMAAREKVIAELEQILQIQLD